MYGDKIYLTGVHTKTGASVTQELTVGTEQALDTIEVAGFVKKNTTKLEKTLPADFKSGEWYLLFNAYDQNGCLIQAGGLADTDVSIISDNVLVVSSVKGVQETPISIDDVEYNAILVEPGIKVSDGGAVKLTAIALRTGNKTEYDCIVGVDQVIVSFTMSAPAEVVADGDSVEIPFEALDEDGNKVTNFVTLAKHKTFNALSFSVGGEGNLVLAEQADGSAKLTYVDEEIGWADSRATDGIDRPVSLTAIVVGGDTDNQMISISDKRRPDAIKDVDLDDVYVEGAEIDLDIDDITFYDQYNVVMTAAKAAAFFAADRYTGSTDFNGYNFTVQATYTGNGGLYVPDEENGQPYVAPDDGIEESGELLTTAVKTGWILSNNNTIANLGFGGQEGNNDPTVFATENVVSSRTNEGFKFEIVKIKSADIGADDQLEKFEVTSRMKSKTFTIVDIKAVKNFTIKDLGTLYIGTGTVTADGKIASDNDTQTALYDDDLDAFAIEEGITLGIGAEAENDYQKAVVVTGTYNGKTVTVPWTYFTAAGNKVAAGVNGDADGWIINQLIPLDEDENSATYAPNGLTIEDLYDKTSARGVAKLGSDTIKATIWDAWGEALDPDTALDLEAAIEIAPLKGVDEVGELDGAAEADDMRDTDNPTDYSTDKTYAQAIEAINARLAALAAINPADYNAAGAEDADLSEQAAAAIAAETNELLVARALLQADLLPAVVDTASVTVSLSDQDPKAASFSGLEDAYTIAPALTGINEDTIEDELEDVVVLDQYGIQVMAGVDTPVDITLVNKKVNNITENTSGYVDDNFTTTGNNSLIIGINGAERGDTFTLTLSYEDIEASTAITVGADEWAIIDKNKNWYITDETVEDEDGNDVPVGLKATLEAQRKAILDIA